MKKKSVGKKILIAVLVLLLVAAAAFLLKYRTRLKTMSSVAKLTSYEDGYDLYTMDIGYDYDLDAMLARGITDNQSFIDTLLKEALPLLPVHMEAPSFGCSAFTMKTADGKVLMGRNYDFKLDTSSMMVYCHPKNGYKSIAFAALDNVNANDALGSTASKFACLLAPFVCLDGVNEKGVSIAVLTLDCEPTFQHTGKTVIATTLAIRLVLDRAATSDEAVALLAGYDMFATSGRDYHFYITDASGHGLVVEYDPLDEARPMIVTETNVITNYFGKYADLIIPSQHNGIYGHGMERTNRILAVMDAHPDDAGREHAWEALEASAQLPNPEDVTSNTQWSIVFENTDPSAEICLRRRYGETFSFRLADLG